ncbi:MAG: hypothetical protein U0401_22680 [Anaerolineae bacterium]
MPQPAFKVNRLLFVLIITILSLSAIATSSFTILTPAVSILEASAAQALNNVIRNGDFENNPTSSVATYWQPYHNGQAHFGWYDEKWAEAVHTGQHSQLMEIFQVEEPVPDRVIAIYQTVDVVPNTLYNLTFFAMMRTDAPIELRNKDQYGMDWGIDYTGQGKYHLVQQWQPITLTEQLRIGSNTVSVDEPARLFFEQITGSVLTGNTRRLTLFIRGVKREPTGTEVNFNIDDVTLLGPYPLPPTPTPTPTGTPTIPRTATPTTTPTRTQTPVPVFTPTTAPTPTPTLFILEELPPLPPLPVTGNQAAPPAEPEPLPAAGGVLAQPLSLGVLFLGGLTLLVLGAYAVHSLVVKQKKP